MTSLPRRSTRSRSPYSMHDSGFTIIELMIATLVFSVILLITTAGILQFTKQYYKGVISSSTQSAARLLVNDISQSIQFNGGSVSTIADGICIGSSKRYSYTLNRQVDDTPQASLHQGLHGLVSDSVIGCSTGTVALDVPNLPKDLSTYNPVLSNPRELLGQHMRLSKFSVTPYGDLYSVTVKIMYGDDDVFCSPSTANDCTDGSSLDGINANKPDLICRPSIGSAYCATSELTTTVMKRVN